MNAIDKFFLWFFMLPSMLYEKAGVNTLQLRAILSAKLTMDNRRQSAFKTQNQRKEQKDINKATLGTMFGALLMGFFMMFCFLNNTESTTQMTFFMTMFIFMLCITLITDFTSVLIDVRDNLIILPKPLSDATFVASRLLHITIRTSLIVVPMVLPSMILIIFKIGPFVVLPFMLMVLMCSMFSIFLINAVYILILKITTPSKFQAIISYIQIGFTIFIFASYQILPRMMQNSAIEHLRLEEMPYIGFFPPYWFADACLSMAYFDFSGMGGFSLLLAMLTPILSIWIVIRYFAPSFNRKLSMITARTEEKTTAAEKTTNKKKLVFQEKLASFFTKTGSEYMGFLFGWKMMSRSRDFKMKVYPAFGSLIVLAVIFTNGGPFNAQSATHDENLMKILMTVIYLSSMILTTAIGNLPFSDKYKASWIFYSAPVESPGRVISGAVKSAMVSLYMPLALLIAILGIAFMGPGSILNILLGVLNVFTIGAVNAYSTVRKLPFSNVLNGTANGGSFVKTMLLLFAMGAVGVIHYFISGFFWAVLLLIVLSLGILWLVFSEIKALDWDDLD